MTHVPGVVASLEVNEAAPHPPLAVGELNVGVAGQKIVSSAPTPVITGWVLSSTVIVWEAVAVLPH